MQVGSSGWMALVQWGCWNHQICNLSSKSSRPGRPKTDTFDIWILISIFLKLSTSQCVRGVFAFGAGLFLGNVRLPQDATSYRLGWGSYTRPGADEGCVDGLEIGWTMWFDVRVKAQLPQGLDGLILSCLAHESITKIVCPLSDHV